MIILSGSMGAWVQNAPDRLRTLLATIIANRASVIVGSLFWLLILSQEDLVKKETLLVLPKNDTLKHMTFAVAVTFGIIERLSSSGNLISMERDWVVTVAAPPGHPYDLTHLNAVMRRIDLVCKLISPIFISVVISATDSVRIGVIYSALTSLVSIPIETASAKGVWNSSPVLRVPKTKKKPTENASVPAPAHSVPWTSHIRQFLGGFEMYFSTTVWVPSVALALLHFNMMTWRATFVTYLINVGYTLPAITIARAVGSIFEISSTVATPLGIQYMGKAYHKHQGLGGEDDRELEVGLIDEADDEQQRQVADGRTVVGLQRFGLWGVSWQVLNLVSRNITDSNTQMRWCDVLCIANMVSGPRSRCSVGHLLVERGQTGDDVLVWVRKPTRLALEPDDIRVPLLLPLRGLGVRPDHAAVDTGPRPCAPEIHVRRRRDVRRQRLRDPRSGSGDFLPSDGAVQVVVAGELRGGDGRLANVCRMGQGATGPSAALGEAGRME